MIESGPLSRIGVVSASRIPGSVIPGLDLPNAGPAVWGSCGMEGRAAVLGQALEVQHPADQVRPSPDPGQPAAAEVDLTRP